MTLDTLIKNARVVLETGIARIDVGIEGGRIAALLDNSDGINARQSIDAGGQLLLPGAIDIHFHCRAPAWPQRGDFSTETRAAAAGGVTTIFEMPVSKPCCATVDIFRRRKALADADAWVNYALYAAPGLLQREEVLGMAAEGAIAFKIFMTSAPAGRDDEFEGLCLVDAPEQLAAMQLVAETGRVLVAHAENNALLEHYMGQLRAAGRNDLQAHNESRPPHVEALAIANLISLNEIAGVRLHIAHVSSRAALATIQRYQAEGADVTGETCPHYLFFTEEDFLRVGAWARVNPPIRGQDDQDALWDGLADGSLLAVTTDHSPFMVEEKERAQTDIFAVPPGAPGVEELVPSMMDAALSGRLSVEEAVRLISTNGARRFGIYPRKGVIAPGADADLVLYDPEATTTIHQDMLFSKARACDKLYEGMTFRGRVTRTLVNGAPVFADGEIVGVRGSGRFVRPNGS
ncbi:MAG: dihydroorotase family protein [Anaerolineaceae bacterium]|nr:dihydroorotase family protein [Anaerolineaceae bacterium]